MSYIKRQGIGGIFDSDRIICDQRTGLSCLSCLGIPEAVAPHALPWLRIELGGELTQTY